MGWKTGAFMVLWGWNFKRKLYTVVALYFPLIFFSQNEGASQLGYLAYRILTRQLKFPNYFLHKGSYSTVSPENSVNGFAADHNFI